MRSRAKAGASAPRTGSHRPREAGAAPTFPGGKGLAGRWSRTQEGGDALGLPGTVTATARPGECAELPKGCSAHGGTRRDPEQLKGLGRRLRGGGCAAPGAARRGSGRGRGSVRRGLRGSRSSSGGLGRRLRGEAAARRGRERESNSAGVEHRAPGHSPGSGLPPGQAEARRAQDSKDTPAPS